MKIANPRVTMIAQTVPSSATGILDEAVAASEWLYPQPGSSKAEYLTEFAGRACYQSFSRPNPATEKTEDYIRRTLFEQGHWSIAEHASATFYITGVSRAFTHELIRHRHLSYSQLSQRFVNEDDAAYVVPPAMSEDERLRMSLEMDLEGSLDYYNDAVEDLLNKGLTRKQAREAARAFLPNMVETKIVVTGNLRAWHEFCERRMQPDADAEMAKVATMIYDELSNFAPTIFLKVEDEEEPTEEELRQLRADKLADLSQRTVIRVADAEYVKSDIGWGRVGSRLLWATDQVAALGDFEILYQEV